MALLGCDLGCSSMVSEGVRAQWETLRVGPLRLCALRRSRLGKLQLHPLPLSGRGCKVNELVTRGPRSRCVDGSMRKVFVTASIGPPSRGCDGGRTLFSRV